MLQKRRRRKCKMRKLQRIVISLCVIMTILSGCQTVTTNGDTSVVHTYAMTDRVVQNPYAGFVVNAENASVPDEHSMVYIDITFAELQPNSMDEFDFASIEEKNNLSYWKSLGKHAVLRFVCDLPGAEAHMDIPQWLYEITGDGDFYDLGYGVGYSPNYANPVFIKYHGKALEALGAYFSDGFVSYVQLGSLGHWGEWHVLYSAGVQRLPDSSIRQEYVDQYVASFPDKKLMMRRPFAAAEEYGMGLFNDMTGDVVDTLEWLDWIEYGGEFEQTEEEDALVAMPEYWKTAPVGGEFTSGIPMGQMCGEDLEQTLSLLEMSHTSFIGPQCPISSVYSKEVSKKSVSRILNTIGYRIGITQAVIQPNSDGDGYTVSLQWENDGIAPIYFEAPVKLYLKDRNGIQELATVDVDLTELMPDESVVSTTKLPGGISYKGKKLLVGIVDPMTGKPAISLVSNQKQAKGTFFKLHHFS